MSVSTDLELLRKWKPGNDLFALVADAAGGRIVIAESNSMRSLLAIGKTSGNPLYYRLTLATVEVVKIDPEATDSVSPKTFRPGR